MKLKNKLKFLPFMACGVALGLDLSIGVNAEWYGCDTYEGENPLSQVNPTLSYSSVYLDQLAVANARGTSYDSWTDVYMYQTLWKLNYNYLNGYRGVYASYTCCIDCEEFYNWFSECDWNDNFDYDEYIYYYIANNMIVGVVPIEFVWLDSNGVYQSGYNSNLTNCSSYVSSPNYGGTFNANYYGSYTAYDYSYLITSDSYDMSDYTGEISFVVSSYIDLNDKNSYDSSPSSHGYINDYWRYTLSNLTSSCMLYTYQTAYPDWLSYSPMRLCVSENLADTTLTDAEITRISIEKYNEGYQAAKSVYQDIDSNIFLSLFDSVLSSPIKIFQQIFDFELFGLNISGLVFGLLSCLLVIWLIKWFI